ncbi:hypothetical protein V1527DRAFT_411503 [Lipomyces starkeyi]
MFSSLLIFTANLTISAVVDLVGKDKKDILAGLRKSVSQRLHELQKDYDALRLQKEDLETDRQRQGDLLNKTLLEKESIYQNLTASHEELLEVSRANTALRSSLVSLDPNAGGYESELKSWVIDLQKRVETQREKLRKSQAYIKKLKAENESHYRKAPDESKKVQRYNDDFVSNELTFCRGQFQLRKQPQLNENSLS